MRILFCYIENLYILCILYNTAVLASDMDFHTFKNDLNFLSPPFLIRKHFSALTSQFPKFSEALSVDTSLHSTRRSRISAV